MEGTAEVLFDVLFQVNLILELYWFVDKQKQNILKYLLCLHFRKLKVGVLGETITTEIGGSENLLEDFSWYFFNTC